MSLSKEAETKIATALNEVVDLVNEGASPTDAVVKVASAHRMLPGHVNLMVNAYNIGRSEAQRKGTADLFEKVSEFELADAAQAVDRMFPDVVKSAGVLARETVVSPEYSHPPRFLAERKRLTKLADGKVIDWKMVAVAPPPLPRDPHTAVKRAYSKLVDHKRMFEETRRSAQHFFDTANGLVEKLAQELRRPNAPLFTEVAENSRIMFGKRAELLMARLAETNKVLTKQAAQGRTASVNEACALVGKVLDAAESFELAREAHEKAAATFDEEAGDTARPFVSAAQAPGSVLGQFSNEKVAFLGGLFGTAVGSGFGRAVGDKIVKPTESLQAGMKNKLTDPQHEATMRNIQTESMLSDLMANDDVISGYDPNEVVNHFNEISQLSPRSTNQSGLMRALLRKRLQQGALDPYEVDMLLKIESGLKNRDNPQSGGVLNGPAGVM